MPHRRHQLGKRRTALAGAALLCLTRAAAYLPAIRTQPVQEPLMIAAAERGWVLMVYVAGWSIAGIVALLHMKRGILFLPMVLAVGMSTMWGTAWFIGWALNPDTMWWQTATLYWGAAIMFGSMVTMIPRLPLLVRGEDE